MVDEISTTEKKFDLGETVKTGVRELPGFLKRTVFGVLGFGIMLGVGKCIEQVPYVDETIGTISKFLVGIDTTGEIPNFLGVNGFCDVFRRFGRREYLYRNGKLYRGIQNELR